MDKIKKTLQGEIVVKRFAIKALPTRITQKGKRLLIEEIDIEGRGV
ncbi:MAG: hypothetical protein WCG05_04300 [Alphaproteobacteria bacterium]